eukprot:3622843-Amphidinium_carterae.2
MQKEQLRIVGALSHNGSYRHNGNPRQPVIGEQVTVSGLRNRPHLNGAQAAIMKNHAFRLESTHTHPHSWHLMIIAFVVLLMLVTLIILRKGLLTENGRAKST